MLQTAQSTAKEGSNLMTRRDLLWAAFTAAAVGGALINGGCSRSSSEVSTDFKTVLKSFMDAVARFRPDWQNSLAAGVRPALDENFDWNLEHGRQTLLLVQNLLALHERVLVDSFNCGYLDTGPCLYVDAMTYPGMLPSDWNGGLSAIPEIGELSRCAIWIRRESVTELRSLRDKIDDVAALPASDCGQVEAVLYADLSTQLGILADRIEAKTLLAGENILHHRHKTGDTSELVGRTEHLEESIKQLEQLAAIRKKKAARK